MATSDPHEEMDSDLLPWDKDDILAPPVLIPGLPVPGEGGVTVAPTWRNVKRVVKGVIDFEC